MILISVKDDATFAALSKRITDYLTSKDINVEKEFFKKNIGTADQMASVLDEFRKINNEFYIIFDTDFVKNKVIPQEWSKNSVDYHFSTKDKEEKLTYYHVLDWVMAHTSYVIVSEFLTPIFTKANSELKPNASLKDIFQNQTEISVFPVPPCEAKRTN